MSGLEYIIGDTINEFPNNHLPTLKDVLCFYSQYWGAQGSDSLKEKLVARELIQVYQRQNIPTLNEKTIKDKIKKKVSELKKNLKFKTKITMAANNIETERIFRSRLQEVFDVSKRENRTEIGINDFSNGGPSSLTFDGILFIFT